MCVTERPTCNQGPRNSGGLLKVPFPLECHLPGPILQESAKDAASSALMSGSESSPPIGLRAPTDRIHVWMIFGSPKHLVGPHLYLLGGTLRGLFHNSYVDSASITRMAVRTLENPKSSGHHHQGYKPTWTPLKFLMLFLLVVGVVYTLGSQLQVKEQADKRFDQRFDL